MSQFAFGCNEYEGVGCPAVQAGIHPIDNGFAAAVAEIYDEHVQSDQCEGLIDEEEARRAWSWALKEIRHGSSEAEVAEEIARRNGWL